MLNLFAAAGRINYAKSARLYLQSTCELPEQYPWLHQCFMEKDYHTIRRSDRYWAGLLLNDQIRPVSMRSIRSRGGLSRGRGMNDGVITMWCHTIHRLASIHGAMSQLTSQFHQTSHQHIELRNARIERDITDLTTIQTWFKDHQPSDEEVTIDPMTLFSRLIALVTRENDVASYFSYELSPYGIMRDATKSKLRQYLTKNVDSCELPTSLIHVVGGGAVLHLVKWLPNVTYEVVIKQ